MKKIVPIYKDYIWGGSRLKEKYGKYVDGDILAESWELSSHPDGMCLVEDEGNQLTLKEYIESQGEGVLGYKGRDNKELPILIKLIDAKQDLSIQVHPDDEYALKNEKQLGKTEMWYILEAEDGAQLVYGLNQDVTKNELKYLIDNNKLGEVLNYVSVKKGDVFLVEPGTIHAIGKGILLAEVQQNSNITYRVYDYGRKDTNGNLRELHINKALEVINLKKMNNITSTYEIKENEGYSSKLLTQCTYFNVELIEVEKVARMTVDKRSFQSLLIIEGEGIIQNSSNRLEIKKGDSIFISAEEKEYSIEGKLKIIKSTL
ncbi:MAG: class I mannose-6-phosphate isomerase [Cellulosilyticum sp.]|nr:class I mannose-6-phosphate isomerase [Cellulosilyticum sp.]